MRIGQILGRLVRLTDHDVEEILQEQSFSGKRFGEIAMAWGLCTPEHVWQAWADQQCGDVRYVDLSRLGIDAQATGYLSADQAYAHHAVPVRVHDDVLVVAVSSDQDIPPLRELLADAKPKVLFVLADAPEIDDAIRQYYGAEAVAA